MKFQLSLNYTVVIKLSYLFSFSHSDQRNFVCMFCENKFKRKDKLNDHIKRMHLSTRKKKPPSPKNKKFLPKVFYFCSIILLI